MIPRLSKSHSCRRRKQEMKSTQSCSDLREQIMLDRSPSGVLAVALVATLMTMMPPLVGAQAADDGKYPTNWKGQWTRVVYRNVEVQGAFVLTNPWGVGQDAQLQHANEKVH